MMDAEPDKQIGKVVDDEMTDATIDAKVAAAEARTDTKFAELRGEIRLANAETSAKLDKVLLAVEATNGKLAGFETKLGGFETKLGGFETKLGGFETKLAEQGINLDKKFAEQSANLDKKLGEQRSEIKADFRATRALTVALFAFVLAAMGLMFNIGGTMFSRGMQIRDVVRAVHAEEAKQVPAKGP